MKERKNGMKDRINFETDAKGQSKRKMDTN